MWETRKNPTVGCVLRDELAAPLSRVGFLEGVLDLQRGHHCGSTDLSSPCYDSSPWVIARRHEGVRGVSPCQDAFDST